MAVLGTVEHRGQLAGLGVDVGDRSGVAIVDVAVDGLHHLVAGGEGPPEAFDLAFAGRVQCSLQCDVQRLGAGAAPVHRARDPDVADGVEAEALR